MSNRAKQRSDPVHSFHEPLSVVTRFYFIATPTTVWPYVAKSSAGRPALVETVAETFVVFSEHRVDS